MSGGHRTTARRVRRHAIYCAVTSAVAIGALPTLAQNTGGPLLTFDIASTLRASDNETLTPGPTGNTILSETKLTFGVESVTQIDALRLQVSGLFRAGDGPGSPTTPGVQSPTVRLTYDRQVRNAKLNVLLDINTRNLNTDVPPTAPGTPANLIVDQGQLTTSQLRIGLETGLVAPVGTRTTIDYVDRQYSGTTDPNLFDNTTLGLQTGLILRPDQATNLNLTYGWSEYTAEDATRTERLTQSLTFGASRTLGTATTVSGRLGWSEVQETWRAVPLDLPRKSGLVAGLTLARTLPDGSLTADLAQGLTSAGGRTDLSVTRVLTLPTGQLSAQLGASQVAGSGIEPVGQISYSYQLPAQTFDVAMSSDITVDSQSVVQRTTRLSLGYGQQISAIDRLNLNLSYDWAGNDIGTVDRERGTFTASYNRDLTADWSMSTGYTYRKSDDLNSGPAESNALFLTLQRGFSWRP